MSNDILEDYFTYVEENFDPKWQKVYPERIKLIQFFKECNKHSDKKYYENQAIEVFTSMSLENEYKVNPNDPEKQFQLSVLQLKDFFKVILITSNTINQTLQQPSENYGSTISELLKIGEIYGRLEGLYLPLEEEPIMLALNMAQEELGISKIEENRSYGDELIPKKNIHKNEDNNWSVADFFNG